MSSCSKPILTLTLLTLIGGYGQCACTITGILPSGVKIGTKVDVNLTGKFDVWPISFWCSNPIIKIIPLSTKGSISVEVPASVHPEWLWIRGYDSKGFSEAKPFFVGNINEIQETETNDKTQTAQKLIEPSVITGRLAKSGDIDCFSYPLQKGETLVASLCANQILNSPMDSVLQIVSSDGFVLGQNHDEKNLDPELVFKAPKEGIYIIRLFAFPAEPNSTIRFAGDNSYLYRLTITNGPFALVPFPIAIPAKHSGLVTIRGWNLNKNCDTVYVKASLNQKDTLFHPLWPNTITAIRSEGESHLHNSKSNIALTVPSTISLDSATIKAPNTMFLKMVKGKGIDIKAKSHSLGFLMTPIIRVRDSKGKIVHVFEPNDLHQDTYGTLTLSTDEIYKFEVYDLFDHISPRHICILEITDLQPNFEINSKSDSILITDKKQTVLMVNVTKKNGFSEPIEIFASGLPIGFNCKQEQTQKKDGLSISLTFSAGPAATQGAFQLTACVKGSNMPNRRIMAKSGNGPDQPFFWIQSIPEINKTGNIKK